MHTHSDACELKCGKTEHTAHTDVCLACGHVCSLKCFQAVSGFGTQYDLIETNKPSGITIETPVSGTVYTYVTGDWIKTTHYYLYLNGKWYCAKEGEYIGGGDTTEITSVCSHTHSSSCYTCEYHEHTDACYGCGKEVHTHDTNCTGTVEGLDSTLWKFVRSETVTVNPDGTSVINVYYDRVEYSVQFYSNQKCTNEYTDLKITAKWGANILSQWPKYNGSSSWYVPNKNDTWQNSIQIMPVGGAKFWGPKEGSSSYSANYYVEALPGDTDTFEHNGVTYKLHHTDTSSSRGNVTDEERYAIEGFTYKEGTANGESYSGAKFYYVRQRYNIEFYNPTKLLETKTGVPYQDPLTSYDWTPNASMAPDVYEPGSVEFEGWYLNPECTGEKFDFTTHTMPAGTNDGDTTLTLYAKWVPVTRTVTFYLDKAAMESGATPLGTRTTPHGSLIDRVDEPTNGGYTFNGWYYMDGGVEKRFLFETMVITKDMNVYAKWSSNVLKEYIVYFKVQDTDIQIADPITGSTRAGETKTFDAKGDDALYVKYRDGYFPVVKSHSMTLEINTPETAGTDANGIEWVEITNADGSKKIVQSFTFWYVQKDAVPYTVYYVAETLKDGEDPTRYQTIEREGKTYYIIADTYTNSENRKAVVTENFKPVTGYMPDAYQKRLVVDGIDGAVNEIIFYYSVDSTHAYYKITHYTQNTDGKNWTEYASSEAVGTIEQTYSAQPISIDGFTYNPNVEGTVVSGELTAEGLELKLYYTRNSYPYEVRYLEQGTGKQLADPKPGTGLYGAVVSESAIDIENYTAVDPTSQTLTIKIEKNDTAKLNIMTFYYVEKEATISYVAVGPDGCGTISLASETVKVLTGAATGSTATANKNYRFVGWYSDEACTKQVSSNATYVPAKPEDGWSNVTYYAKFELALVDLTIIKEGCSSADEHQSFIFDVTGPNGFKLTVTINGNGSATIKDLPIGEYTVIERINWSWRYSPVDTAQNIELAADKNTVTFDNQRFNIFWLSGDSCKENQFTVKRKNEED